MGISKIGLNIFFTFLLFSIIALGDRGQWDCQDNEFFIECGGCEGTCKEPVIANCSKTCKPGRCECQALNGFVRSHDGACIKFEDCGSYVGIEIYGDANPKMLGRESPPMAAIPPVLSNQQPPPSDSEDYHQTENNNFQSNNNYDDETEATPASAFAAADANNNPFQQAASLLAPTHAPSEKQHQQPQETDNNKNYHPAKISETGPYYPSSSSSINSNQYRRRFRHRF